MKEIRFLSPATTEMMTAARYYERQAVNLGRDFLSEVQSVVNRIAENPLLAPKVRGETRRRLLRQFPFGILYRIEPDEIIILAVMHQHRKPGYWIKRRE